MLLWKPTFVASFYDVAVLSLVCVVAVGRLLQPTTDCRTKSDGGVHASCFWFLQWTYCTPPGTPPGSHFHRDACCSNVLQTPCNSRRYAQTAHSYIPGLRGSHCWSSGTCFLPQHTYLWAGYGAVPQNLHTLLGHS